MLGRRWFDDCVRRPDLNSNPEAHKQRRKLLARGFAQSSLLEYEPNISNKIETLLNKWAALAKNEELINVYPWVYWLGFDTVCTYRSSSELCLVL